MVPDIRLYEELSDLEQMSLMSTSYSRLNTFDWCQAQYFYSYVLKLPQEFGDKALLGNVIHKAIEISSRDGEQLSLVELLENYEAARGEFDPDNKIISDELYATGVEMLQLYVSQQVGKKVEITHAEFPFSIVFKGALLRGFIDSVFVKGDKVTVVDYKSGKWEVANNAIATNLQLGIYALVMKYYHPDKTITAGLRYLQSGKVKKHTYSDEDLILIQNNLEEKIEDVREHNNFLPTKDIWKCNTCTYASEDVCKAGLFNISKNNQRKNKLVKVDLGTPV